MNVWFQNVEPRANFCDSFKLYWYKVAQKFSAPKAKSCSRLLKSKKVRQNVKIGSKVAEHNLFRPNGRDRGEGGGGGAVIF